MFRPFTRHAAKLIGLLLAVIATAITLQPFAATAQTTGGQATSPQTAGTASVEFSDAWQFNPDASNVDSVFLGHGSLKGTAFIYAEITDPATDADQAIGDFSSGFFAEFGDGDQAVVNGGTVSTNTSWQLFKVGVDTVPFGVFVSANVGTLPGEVLITTLVSPVGSFDRAMTSVLEGISVNGAGTTMSLLDPATMVASLSGEIPSGQTGTTETPTSVEGQGRGGLTLPPLGGSTTTPAQPTPTGQTTTPTEPAGQTTAPLTGSVTVNGAQVMYGGDWVYSESASTQDQIAFFTHSTSVSTVFGYASTVSATNDVLADIKGFNDGFFESYGGTNVVEVSTETLPSGHAYSLYTLDRDTTPFVVVVFADSTTVPGEFRAQVLITPRAEFGTIFPALQQSLQVDGVMAMSELDQSQLDALMNGGTQGQTTTTTTTTTTQGASDVVSKLQAADAQGTCDGIGWVIVSPDQVPASEADINYRSACVGGGTFVAFCGTSTGSTSVAPEPGTVWIRCDISARADAAPLTVTPLDFTLIDGSGTEHTLDFMALFGLSGVGNFPDAAIPAGQTAQGTVAFSVPDTTTGPWLLTVNPASLQTSGEQPGQLVIDGELQPFDVFGQ